MTPTEPPHEPPDSRPAAGHLDRLTAAKIGDDAHTWGKALYAPNPTTGRVSPASTLSSRSGATTAFR
ncbi:MAG: hypothetical protein U1F21_07295 [Sphaerotilus natans]